MPSIAFATLGCKVNQSETEALARRFAAAGFQVVNWDEPAAVVVVNTCTVTHVGDRKSRQLLRRATRRNPGALIVAAGCYATVDPTALQALPGVGLVVPNAHKDRLFELVTEHLALMPDVAPEASTPAPAGRTRALVKVQDGCADHCTYCIVPQARGAPHSRQVLDVLAEVRDRLAAGYQEIVLTGVHLGQYGHDQGAGAPGLGDLIHAILQDTNLARLRLSSIEPQDLDPALLDLWQYQRLCRHLALPLQSGCDRTLTRMGRRYMATDYAALVRQIRQAVPLMALTTDVIVGFPGETDEDHQASLDFAQALGLARIHVFPYSPRRGTLAATMPDQVPAPVKQARAWAFRTLSAGSGRRYRTQFVGQMADVLWETPGPAQGHGLTDTYIRVTTPDTRQPAGRITPVHLIAVTADGMIGTG